MTVGSNYPADSLIHLGAGHGAGLGWAGLGWAGLGWAGLAGLDISPGLTHSSLQTLI